MNRKKVVDILIIHFCLAGFMSSYALLIKGDHITWVHCVIGGNLFSALLIFVIYAGVCADKLFNKEPWKNR